LSDRIELIDLCARHAEVASEVELQVVEVLRSGRYVGGAPVAQLEAEMAAQMACAHGVGVGSGTAGLFLGLQALGVSPGDEVILPAVSFFATAGAVLQLGATPVVVDVLPDRPLMDPDLVAAAVTDRTRAVVPVHLFGSAAALPQLGLPVLVDAAQAVGASPAVPVGDVAVVSFYPTKVLGGAGDGGMVVTSDEALATRVRCLANHGGARHEMPGINSRLDAIQAAVVRVHMGRLESRVARRQAIARHLDAAAGGRAVPRDSGSPVTVWALRHSDRIGLAGACEAAGISTRVYYDQPLSERPAMQGRCRVPAPLLQAEAFCQDVLALPCHEALTDEQVDRLTAVLEAWA